MNDFNRGGYGGQKDEFEAECAECKQKCTVPFKPNPERGPVYCRDCFRKRRQEGRR